MFYQLFKIPIKNYTAFTYLGSNWSMSRLCCLLSLTSLDDCKHTAWNLFRSSYPPMICNSSPIAFVTTKSVVNWWTTDKREKVKEPQSPMNTSSADKMDNQQNKCTKPKPTNNLRSIANQRNKHGYFRTYQPINQYNQSMNTVQIHPSSIFQYGELATSETLRVILIQFEMLNMITLLETSREKPIRHWSNIQDLFKHIRKLLLGMKRELAYLLFSIIFLRYSDHLISLHCFWSIISQCFKNWKQTSFQARGSCFLDLLHNFQMLGPLFIHSSPH